MGRNVTTPEGPTSRKVREARRELVERLPVARFGRTVVDEEWLGARLAEEPGEAGARFPWRATRLRTELIAALPQAGDRRKLEGLLSTLDRLSSAPRAHLAPGLDPPNDLLFQPVNATDLPRIRRPPPGEPDFDWNAAATEHMASWGRLPCDPRPRDTLTAMKVAFLSDIARRPLVGALRRAPPALPQPLPPLQWRKRRPLSDFPEPLLCAACASLGRAMPLVNFRRHDRLGRYWYHVDEAAVCRLHPAGPSCAYGHESHDSSRRRAIEQLPEDARLHYLADDAGREYGQPLGPVAEEMVNGEPQCPVPTRRTVENWRADGRRALARLGFWPWAAAPEEGKLGRVWWREARYASALRDALDREAQRIEALRGMGATPNGRRT